MSCRPPTRWGAGAIFESSLLDILFSAPKRPPYLPIPQRLANVLARPLLRIQRDIVASTVSDPTIPSVPTAA